MLFSVQVWLPGNRAGCPWKGKPALYKCTLVIGTIQAKITFLKLGVAIFKKQIHPLPRQGRCVWTEPTSIPGGDSFGSLWSKLLVLALSPKRFSGQKEGGFSD